MENINDTTEWLSGANDVKEGNEHQEGQSEDYDRGYAKQYEFEQIKDAKTA